MKFCSRCLYPTTHPLGLTLDADGICSGCRVHEEKDTLDWAARGRKLAVLLEHYRRTKNTNYDCVVPISGARDSYFIVDVVKNRYRLNPLLVTYNRLYNTPRGQRNLAYLRTLFDCDIMQLIPSEPFVKQVTRKTLDVMGSMYWHCLAGQTVWPVQVAARYRIPLIIWGAHQGLEQVGMYSHLDEVEMTRRYRKDHDLMGFEAEDLVCDDLPEREMRLFFYPHDKDIEAVGVRGIYLGNYIRWDTKAQHEEMIGRYDYETGLQQRTFDKYNDVDCVHYSGVHDLIKYRKHGFGRATDHACRELRYGRLSRAEALVVAQHHQARQPTDLDGFLDWAGLDQASFAAKIDAHRNPAVWALKDGEWQLRADVFQKAAAVPLQDGEAPGCCFHLTPSRAQDRDETERVILDRGFQDR